MLLLRRDSPVVDALMVSVVGIFRKSVTAAVLAVLMRGDSATL
jgi:hypothetical protein